MTTVNYINGTDILLLVNTGPTLTPTYEVVGSQRDATFEETNDEIDVSSKEQREKRVIAGRYSCAVSFDAMYVPSDTAYQALKAAMRNGTAIMILRQQSGAALEEASAIVTGLSEAAPDQDASTVSVRLTVDDQWIEVGT
jgi:TP901-1 family phage major tail protein